MPILLAFIPHPDDESYSFGGLLALAARAGWDCTVHAATSGEKGKRHDDPAAGSSPQSVQECREAELRRSCQILGLRPPDFWRLPDGGLPAMSPRRAPINELLRTVAPDLVVTLGPDGAYGHPDHTTLHRWVAGQWAALPRHRPPLLFPVFPKGLFLPQWEKVRAKLGEPPEPPAGAIGSDDWHYELSISGVRETKLASIAAHRSQLPDGEPGSLFPPGIVAALLEIERFADASGRPQPAVRDLLSSLATQPHS